MTLLLLAAAFLSLAGAVRFRAHLDWSDREVDFSHSVLSGLIRIRLEQRCQIGGRS